MSLRHASALGLLLRAPLLAFWSAGSAAAFEPGESPRVDPTLGPLVEAAVAEAARRLDEQPCALILSEFVDDRTGLSLAQSLAATGRTASEHVRSLWFSRSTGLRRFAGQRIFAFTTPSSPVVYLCREELSRVVTKRRLLTAIVIHEVLHTLGLGNDLPSSASITHRVMSVCG